MIFLHVSDAAKHRYRKVMICSVDCEALKLAIVAVQQLSIDELWVGFDFQGHKLQIPMTRHVLSAQRGAQPYPSYMHLVDVTQYHPLVAAEKGRCGT